MDPKSLYVSIDESEFQLPKTYEQFCKEVKGAFEKNAYGLNEELNITYGNGKKVSNAEEYEELKKNIKNLSDKKIKVKLNNNKVTGDNFKKYISNVVENQLKKCRDSIIELLNSDNLEREDKLANTACQKERPEKCKLCDKNIIGFLFKETLEEFTENEKFYCESCAQNLDKPLFKIY